MRINQQSFKLFNYMMLKHKTTHNYELSRLDCDTDSRNIEIRILKHGNKDVNVFPVKFKQYIHSHVSHLRLFSIGSKKG